jgi:hypothetical protein
VPPDTFLRTLCATHSTRPGAECDRVAEREREKISLFPSLKNSWLNEQYKGIDSQWVDSATGQRLELQFHTRISFEAKQLTHGAYERIRTQQADEFEEMVLEAFPQKVTAEVPVPPGAVGIPDYPERGADAR